MYIPAHFAETDPARVAALLAAHPLACLVADTAEGLVANHLPLLAASDGTLIGHVALANDLHRFVPDGQEVLAIFRGPEGYVSPNYYPSKAETHRAVPTWNYEVAHVHGTIAWQHDDHAKRAAVALLTRDHERRVNGAGAWKMADAPGEFIAQMLAGIVAFRITRTRTLAKAKLNQNRTTEDRQGAIAGLRAAGRGAVAEAMAARLGPAEN